MRREGGNKYEFINLLLCGEKWNELIEKWVLVKIVAWADGRHQPLSKHPIDAPGTAQNHRARQNLRQEPPRLRHLRPTPRGTPLHLRRAPRNRQPREPRSSLLPSKPNPFNFLLSAKLQFCYYYGIIDECLGFAIGTGCVL